MKHWQSVLRLRIHEISYESLVADPAGEIRELLDFCGLPWEENCMQFHNSRRAVATPSYDQVRRPIYQQSLQRWRHYENHLVVLRNLLEAK